MRESSSSSRCMSPSWVNDTCAKPKQTRGKIMARVAARDIYCSAHYPLESSVIYPQRPGGGGTALIAGLSSSRFSLLPR